mgnify:CR=1 FL=1
MWEIDEVWKKGVKGGKGIVKVWGRKEEVCEVEECMGCSKNCMVVRKLEMIVEMRVV